MRRSYALFVLLLLLTLTGCTRSSAPPAQPTAAENTLPQEDDKDFVLNLGSKKFHLPECPYAASMQEDNRVPYFGKRWLLIQDGYAPCKSCNP